MKDEKTIMDNESMRNEETQFDNTLNTAGKQQTTGSAKKKGGATWVKIAGSAGTGLLLGAASTMMISATPPRNEAEQEETTGENPTTNGETASSVETNTIGDGSISVATHVNDNMTFNEAFATARHEVGAGGAFEWHGNVYSTYYAEEWHGMTEEQQDNYYSHVMDTPVSAHADTHDTAEVVAVNHSQAQTAANETAYTGETGTENNIEVEVLGVTHDEDSGANVVSMSVGGHNAIMVDVDNDENIDILAVDVNDDGQLTENEVADVSDQGMTIGQFGGVDNPACNLYATNDNLPDYTNDANVDSYNV